ncbi:E3 UFM1-protein ligase 1 [Rattus norvegicus]|uniref:E3 UFM1-protein ligase 1 n=2 Tax=Rattus norvegicus TaxID=10116 RepID=UFL1_RAT|nr:E3 UFM1-protein ligase 1 [Rattus norvegicus]B2GV24.1 RecName: Full=E3 UFM1-protein ligase 1; AltName: Full=E3 UFM1-protein transferase 1; AltName: Full=Multiple alpha-helix protein located at ER; AltName: Full=Regulator of C53/LZAP and DDRGK1 [Rattus norvegicus]AAI66498.1 RGD1309308 protein [Rattus norvegicus]|eukprot:NP_001119751.1 E3 UFM1-protein ligase 1 [Rattus norvegicus]
MADAWEEIRRLAADFQRAQFAESTQRLSERNCIEIVNKLISQKQLEVVHTLDGKEYITPAQISKEMRDELHVRGGRVNIVDLQQVINVDLTHIENRVGDIIKSEKHVQMVLGQLVDENYLDRLSEEVNDKLQESGQVTVSELCKTYDLPGDFLTQALTQRLGRIINGHLDLDNRGVIFTEAFVARHKARIRGLFSAITRPTAVNSLVSKYGFQEQLLYSVLEELVSTGRLRGTVVGGRQDKAVFVPDIYSRTQSTWVDSFFRQNGYLEFDALSRLGIPDAVNYIKKRYKNTPLLFLKATCVGQGLVDQVEASVEEAISSGTWVDVSPLLPSSLSVEDAAMLLQQVMRPFGKHASATVFSDTVVVSEKFINDCTKLFSERMHQKAEKEMKNNPVHLITEEDLKQISILESVNTNKKDKKDERRKKATEGSGSVRGGGGGNAREYKIKKVKKKGRKDEDSDDESQSSHAGKKKPDITFMFQDEIEGCLRKHIPDAPEEFISELAEHLIKPLNKMYLEVVRSVFMSSTSASGTGRKRTIKDLQEEVSNLYNNIRLFEKGMKYFADDTQTALTKHLLKTVCTDITNLMFNFLASDLMMAVEDPATITSDMRKKILSKLTEETKVALTKLHNSLNEKSIEDFLSCLDSATEACDIMVKKGDKKRERQILFQHRQALADQLKVTEDPALILHLTSVLLFQFSTHSMLHAPGRCVPQIIAFLHNKIPEDQHTLLVKYQGLVVKQLVSQNKKSGQGEDPSSDDLDKEQHDVTNTTRKELQELSLSIKDLVLKPRKSSVTEE